MSLQSDTGRFEKWLRKQCHVVKPDVEYKHERMTKNAFVFLRATYYRWARKIEEWCPELAFDNVSGLAPWISDALCRLATGGGFAVRQLYTDQDEVLFDAARPVILNGIEEIVTRPDLADRAVFLTLEPIPEERRRPEAELWSEFEAERPQILGALLNAVAVGLKRLPETRLEKLPRMADFALWATACEPALWPKGTFGAAYCGNLDEAVEGVIDADPIATAVRAFMAARTVGRFGREPPRIFWAP